MKLKEEGCLISNTITLQAIHCYMSGMTKKESAKQAGCSPNIFKHTAVENEIQRRIQRLKKEHVLNEEWIVSQLMEVAGCKIGNMISVENGKPFLDWSKFTDDMRAGVQIFEQESYMKDKRPTTKIKVRMSDRLRAIEMLGKILGIFQTKVSVDMDDEMVKRLTEARNRVSKSE